MLSVNDFLRFFQLTYLIHCIRIVDDRLNPVLLEQNVLLTIRKEELGSGGLTLYARIALKAEDSSEKYVYLKGDRLPLHPCYLVIK